MSGLPSPGARRISAVRPILVRHGGRAAAWLAGFFLVCPAPLRSAEVNRPITALAYRPDGTELISAGPRTLEIRSPADGAIRREVRVESPKIAALAFAPGGRFLAVGGGAPARSGLVLVFGTAIDAPLLSSNHGNDLVTGLAFSPRGQLLVVTGVDGPPRVFAFGSNGPTLTERFILTGHSGAVLAAAFSPDGDWLVTAGADRSLKVWNVTNGVLARSLSQHTEAIHTLAFRPRGTSVPVVGPLDSPDIPTLPDYCASAGDDRTVRIWQPALGRMVRIVRGHEGSILALAYAGDGRTLFSAGQEGIVRRLDADSDAVMERWPGHADWITALAVRPDGRSLASADLSGRVQVRPLTAR